ncbi:MAG: PIN domain-containing protein [Acidimicrobiales bacterium]
MSPPLILDADGLDALSESPPPEALRALLSEAWRRRSDVVVPALVCAECCRGTGRTRAIEAALSRHHGARLSRPAVRVVPTDFDLARRVGSILYGASAPTADVVGAHCVAVAATYGGGIVVTADPRDIERLASAVPAVRVVTRPAR